MISLDFLSDYVDISDQNPKELAKKITEYGINVEKVITNNIANLVVGEVVSCMPHPDSDHLHICEVNIGSETLQIVCGAPNVRSGIKVITALVGCHLPGDFIIKKSSIRGVESNGMLCALYELGLEEKTTEAYNKGIEELDNSFVVGTNPLIALHKNDTVYELDIHKHRNNDCYYHIGFAYIIASILNRKVNLPNLNYSSLKEDVNSKIKLEVQTKKCPYYLAKMVTNIKIKPSPDFIKRRLESVGIRSINNVVDISNYIMMEYGQPLHFFDKDKIEGNLIVRDAKQKEEVITLDNEKRILNSNDIVISDSKKPLCIAGVMGLANSMVDENTKNILIESAIFDAVSIRNTSNKLNLKSEASIRYGKGLNYEYTIDAINRACYLLEEYADALVLNGIVKHDNIDKTERVVTFTKSEVNKLLGITISSEDMELELQKLGFTYIKNKDTFTVTIPNRRSDIDPFVNDIAEEIGQLYGYHNLVSTLPKIEVRRGEYVGDVYSRKTISTRLRSLGLNEVRTYTLISEDMNKLFNYENKETIVLPNPMSSDKAYLRTSLIPSLLNVYNYNKTRKVNDINIYEISKTYDSNYNEESKITILMSGKYLGSDWANNSINVDFYMIKGILENLLNYLGFKNRYSFVKDEIENMHPGMSAKIYLDKDLLGIIGRVHPIDCKDDVFICEISLNKLMRSVKKIKYKSASIYPQIVKDVAFIVDKVTTAEAIIKDIKKSAGKLLTDIKVFDVYTGSNVEENKKSLAFTLTFNSNERTLTDEEVTEKFNKIINYVVEKDKAILRDK